MKAYDVESVIQAPPDAIWKLLTDAPNYPAWNPTVSGVEGRIAPGEKITR